MQQQSKKKKKRRGEKTGYDGEKRSSKIKVELPPRFLIRIIQGETAPGLGGNQHCPEPDYSWHNPDTVLFDVPHPSVLYVVFYLTLK